MKEFVAGVTGAVIGALAIFLAEFWREVLDGHAAARIIYAESHSNSLICDWAAEGNYMLQLSDGAWKANATKVVAILTSEAASAVAIPYLSLPFAQQQITAVRDGLVVTNEIRESLQCLGHDFRKSAHWMYCIEKKGRLALLAGLALGRIEMPTSDEIDRALEAEARKEGRTGRHRTGS